MAAVITFATVVGPADNDLADGVKAFNTIGTDTDNNFALLNTWAGKASANPFALSAVVTGSSLATPGSGYSIETSQTYGRKWGPVTYAEVVVRRTGADIDVGNKGNVDDHTIATLRTGWRPVFQNLVVTVNGVAGPIAVSFHTDGRVNIHAVNAIGETIRNNDVIWAEGTFLNKDPRPI